MPTFTWVQTVAPRVPVLSFSRAQMMPEMPFSSLTATTGRGVSSKFVKIDMLLPVEVWASLSEADSVVACVEDTAAAAAAAASAAAVALEAAVVLAALVAVEEALLVDLLADLVPLSLRLPHHQTPLQTLPPLELTPARSSTSGM